MYNIHSVQYTLYIEHNIHCILNRRRRSPIQRRWFLSQPFFVRVQNWQVDNVVLSTVHPFTNLVSHHVWLCWRHRWLLIETRERGFWKRSVISLLAMESRNSQEPDISFWFFPDLGFFWSKIVELTNFYWLSTDQNPKHSDNSSQFLGSETFGLAVWRTLSCIGDNLVSNVNVLVRTWC